MNLNEEVQKLRDKYEALWVETEGLIRSFVCERDDALAAVEPARHALLEVVKDGRSSYDVAQEVNTALIALPLPAKPVAR